MEQSCLEKIKDLQIAAQDGWKRKEFPHGPRVQAALNLSQGVHWVFNAFSYEVIMQ